MEFRYPHCQAPIYRRKQKICGVCEKSLPPEMLWSENQIAFLKKPEEQREKQAKNIDYPTPTMVLTPAVQAAKT